MLDWYKKFIVPKRLVTVMASKEIEKLRPQTIRNASGVVLEIGVGPGYNIPLYKNVSKLYALEPFLALIEVAKTRANEVNFPIEFLQCGAEQIPLLDASIDTVVSTWTMCSVNDPAKVLKEIRRVLKPSGKFVFVDHGASSNPFYRAIQTVSTPISKHFTGNCHLDRDIVKLVRAAGFEITNLEQFPERYKPLLFNSRGIATITQKIPRF